MQNRGMTLITGLYFRSLDELFCHILYAPTFLTGLGKQGIRIKPNKAGLVMMHVLALKCH